MPGSLSSARRLSALFATPLFWGLACGAMFAQSRAGQQVPQVPGNYLEQTGAQPRFVRFNQLPAALTVALRAGPTASAATAPVRTVPYFTGGFTFKSTSYPYFMVGSDPLRGGETRVDTVAIPLSFFFEGWLDGAGNNISIRVDPVLRKTLNSPDFVKAAYSTGFGQFGDAVQRAEFYNVMKDSWHTTLNPPRRLPPVTIVVPFGQSQVYQLPDGTFLATLNGDFFNSHLSTLLQAEGLKPTELPLFLSNNVFLYFGDPANCCVLGFHTAFDASTPGHPAVQTFAWASWASEGIFSSFSDVTPLSHEISEWRNDPFVNNLAPAWQFPNGRGCEGNLETGDPIKVLSNSTVPVTANGFTYHPQTEALLQWFTREDPSGAFKGAYSYPDTSLLTGVAQDCSAE
jgi:hypothetical protein